MSTAKLTLPPLQQGATYIHALYLKECKNIQSVSIVDPLVTVVTIKPHGYTTGDLISIINLTPAILNLSDIAITVIDTYTFTYVAPTTGLSVTNYSKGKALKATDLTGCTAAQHFRETYTSPLLLEVSTANGGLTIDVPTGKISYFVDALVTAALPAIKGVTDLEMYWPDGTTTRVFEGSWPVKPEVTHP